MTYVNRHPRGQQRDKPYREALRMELAAAGEDMKKLREIARAHISRCEAGDMQAIRELADRLDGKPMQLLEHSGPETRPRITKIVHEFVHLKPRPQLEQRQEKQEPLDVEWKDVTKANGQAHTNGDEHNQP